MASTGVFASNWRDIGDVDSWGAHDSLFGAPTKAQMLQVLNERTEPPAPAAKRTGR
jgi:hypothetical protein